MTMKKQSAFHFPGTLLFQGGIPPSGFVTNSMNALNEYAGIIFIPNENITLHKIAMYVNAVSSFIGVSQMRVETVSTATGLPSGTEVGTGGVFVPGVGWNEGTMAVDASLTAGTAYFVGCKATSVTSGSFTISYGIDISGDQNMPYAVFATTPTKSQEFPNIALEDSGGNKIYIPGAGAAITVAPENYKSDSNPDRRGIRFKLPFPARLVGFAIGGDSDQDFTVILYDSDGASVLQSVTFDKDIGGGDSSSVFLGQIPPTSLLKDVFYRLVILPTTTTANDWFSSITTNAAAELDCWEGGQNFHFTQVNGAPANEAAWTNTTTKRPITFELILDQFDDGTSSGGAANVKYNPGMGGGFNG